jgi:hypothetical protein
MGPERQVDLMMQGDSAEGLHLCMSPEGYSSTDSWHPRLEDALETARRQFGVQPEDWT